MGLETASYIDELDITNPKSNDIADKGDDHIRLLKEVFQKSFPGWNGPVVVGGVDTGVTNAYVLAAELPEYTANTIVIWKPTNNNSDASTIDINGLGTRNIKQIDGSDLAQNDLDSNVYVAMVDNGTEYRLLSITKNYVDQLAFNTALPSQTDNAGKMLLTDGTTASWGATLNSIALSTPLTVANGGTGAVDATVARTNLSVAKKGANSDITSLTGLTTPLGVGFGGTGATSATAARTSLVAARSGANTDITSLGGLTTPLSIAQGGTGATTAGTAISSLIGYTPVQQGTGIGQSGNVVKIGWNAANSRLKATVDVTDLGYMVFDTSSAAAKAWANVTTGGTLNGQLNVSSVVHASTGVFNVTFSPALSSGFYHVSVSIHGTTPLKHTLTSLTTTTFTISTYNSSDALTDPSAGLSFSVHGYS